MRISLFILLISSLLACSSKTLDPSKTLCDPGVDCGQSTPKARIVPLNIRIDEQGLYLGRELISPTECLKHEGEKCTEQVVRQGRARLALKNRKVGAFARPIHPLVKAVRARLNQQQTLATLGGRQILKMSANAQFQLFSEILLSLEQSGVTHLHLGLVGSKPGLDVPVMRSKVTATPSEDRPTVNVALQLRKSGFTLKVHRAYRSDFPEDFFDPVERDPDHSLLAKKLSILKANHPDEDRINITAKNEVTMGRFVQGMRVVIQSFDRPLVVKSLGPKVLKVLDRKMQDQLKNIRDTQQAP